MRSNNLEQIRKNDKFALFETLEVIDGKIYAPLYEENILIKISMDTIEMEMLSERDGYRYRSSVCIKDKIYFADLQGRILIYDTKTEEYKTLTLEGEDNKDDCNIIVGSNAGSVIVFSIVTGKIYILDTEKQRIVVDECLSNALSCDTNVSYEFLSYMPINNQLYIRVKCQDVYSVYQVDLVQKNAKKTELRSLCEKKFLGKYCYSDKLYILTEDYELIIWNVDEGEFQKKELSGLFADIKTTLEANALGAIAVTEKNIWLFPNSGEYIYIYDIHNSKMTKYEGYPSDFGYLNNNRRLWCKYVENKERNGYIYVANRLANYYLMIDTKTGIGTWKTARLDADFYKGYIEKTKDKTIFHEQQIPLKVFLDYGVIK